jgi:hypothetical protein
MKDYEALKAENAHMRKLLTNIVESVGSVIPLIVAIDKARKFLEQDET